MQTKTDNNTQVNIIGITLLSIKEYKDCRDAIALYQEEIITSENQIEFLDTWWLKSSKDILADLVCGNDIQFYFKNYDLGVRPALKIKIIE